MKLILKENPNVELTVTIEYPKQSSQLNRIIQKLKSEEKALVGSENGRDYKVFMPDIFYIESVDKRTFIYTRDMVFRSEKRLYQLENELKEYDFVKVSRNCLVNINELIHIKALANSRLEAELSNGEKIIVSRTYIPEIKRKVFQEV
ncbi:MAG: LytTR family DNA-binding domain-containing protein [Acutalibacteraceae bacterium]|nr:LytTR family DNA-binding domain-containing protein [Acutalibacteraceae bacterium]MEE1076813.1 LytTR family DNA-binding domain-containing protein [Acutalibacteraceae bacterium]MEE1155215.1 LytTR family DNA-binding domain-containing protein [Acutalibacteraceae bacterium]MEE1281793.1 LytTR family DNA-binding domain-containing protein [Acutalibacteraceae bacterium]